MTRSLTKGNIIVRFNPVNPFDKEGLVTIEDSGLLESMDLYPSEARFISEAIQELLTKSSNPPVDEL